MFHSSRKHLFGRAAACAALLALAAPGFGAVSAKGSHGTPTWLTFKGKTVNLTLISSYNGNQGGFNFNGYAQGKMNIMIPVGDKVNVTFSNDGAIPHSVIITDYSKRNGAGSFSMSFKGAASPNPTTGSNKGKTYKFSFVANKAGTYAIVCGVPGHAVAGMWDTLTVTKNGNPTIKTSK